MRRLRIPRKFTKFTLVDTSDEGVLEDGDVSDPETETVSLAGQKSEEGKDEDDGCLGWVRTKWHWKRERERKNQEKLINQIETIGQKIDTHEATMVVIEQDLKKCKQTKSKQKARLLLLKRKRLSNTIQSYYNSRAELEQVLISLEESSDQVALVKSYKTANSILKTTMRQNGSRNAVETYEELAEDLQDAQDDVHELQDAVSRNIGRNDDDLSVELDELFDDSPEVKPTTGSSSNPPPHEKIKKQQTNTELLDSLPSVPLPVAPTSDVAMTDEEAFCELEEPMVA